MRTRTQTTTILIRLTDEQKMQLDKSWSDYQRKHPERVNRSEYVRRCIARCRDQDQCPI